MTLSRREFLGAVPDTRGLIPDADFRRYAEFGRAIRDQIGTPLAQTRGEGATVHLSLGHPLQINQAVMMEDILQGERVRRYALQGRTGGDSWQTLWQGESIGHKRIAVFDRAEVAAVRLVVTEATAPPKIQQLAVYDVTA